ncbi:hypothetical protein Sta7437_0091 [Stanieria cyanosphaera PCC 7437]|uniref:Uncharacterized protein n=1 Tax=Stanieria cyanosphaera (strain ATCC 29371 / PCC 7437) TaxID=111780 RepID=K9XPV6_STAC7|nr:hypothetical protein Sta7437_0091 [Stanieria cyanosphaera PCC 7437]
MEINDLTLWTIILFNAGFCLFLPRIVTLNWSKVFTTKPNSASN